MDAHTGTSMMNFHVLPPLSSSYLRFPFSLSLSTQRSLLRSSHSRSHILIHSIPPPLFSPRSFAVPTLSYQFVTYVYTHCRFLACLLSYFFSPVSIPIFSDSPLSAFRLLFLDSVFTGTLCSRIVIFLFVWEVQRRLNGYTHHDFKF